MSRNHILSVAAAMAVAVSSPALAQSLPFTVTEIADFDVPWALQFLPDGRMLVTEQRGALKLYTPGGSSLAIRGVPKVSYGGQGGFSDLVLHPDFASNGLVYFSYAEAGDGDTRGAVGTVARRGIDLECVSKKLRPTLQF